MNTFENVFLEGQP